MQHQEAPETVTKEQQQLTQYGNSSDHQKAATNAKMLT
jgi:hypothetical protein